MTTSRISALLATIESHIAEFARIDEHLRNSQPPEIIEPMRVERSGYEHLAREHLCHARQPKYPAPRIKLIRRPRSRG